VRSKADQRLDLGDEFAESSILRLRFAECWFQAK
jgi:hypothetical protein